ncbi:MAG: hypothetical protein A3K59_01030 [Euryarchaeota archaeon RBG_19FT_COMBO_69_17]|nr:MAG: hypothetical protein A3K59_01030 [Euryarchaeota archaeon RBG_19FT_COMBO_69_17]
MPTEPLRNEFPGRPVPAVGAIVFRGDAVLLVKRGREPNKGRWSLPGGSLETGETVEAAAVREAREETGVVARALRPAFVGDYVSRDPDGRVRWHYVLIDVLCEYVSGEAVPATDAEEARFVPLRELGDYDVTPTAVEAIGRAAGMRVP